MKLDALVRLIEAADPSAFREIALVCLQERGFEPSLVDGPSDGGADFRVFTLGGAGGAYAVQISVEKNWKTKLSADAKKAKERLKIDRLLFVSSRRIQEVAFQATADEISKNCGVAVQKMDSQYIASLAKERGATGKVLSALGIDVPAPTLKRFQRPDLRQDVAYACAFFGTDAQAFRHTVVENAVYASVFQAGGKAERDAIVSQVALSLGLSHNQRTQVTAAIDRALQKGQLVGKNGVVALAPQGLDNWATLEALSSRDRAALQAQIEALLGPHIRSSRAEVASAILEDLGALWLDQASETSTAIAGDSPSGPVFAQDGLKQRLRRLSATLDTSGVVESSTRQELLRALAKLASTSQLGRALAAGEVFVQLNNLKTPHVFRAFGAGAELLILFDTSVAMPLLCSLLFDTANQDFFVAAKHAYDQLLAHDVTMVLPRDYLEEVASHLLDASTLYSEIADLDPDLRGSRNAFAAHYAALRFSEAIEVGGYQKYLESFGATPALVRGDYIVARDLLMKKLEGLFKRYAIGTQSLGASLSAKKRAEEALSFAMHERNDLQRAPRLLAHDATTLGWLLDSAAADPNIVYVICTWDRLHPLVRDRESADWDVLDPVALGDVLSLAMPGSEDDVRLISPLVVALGLSSEAEKKGAEVWDRLVEIERDKLHDAGLRESARAFKQSWVEATGKDRRARDLQKAWEDWKAAHAG
jgi:hypothetical protein